MNTTHPSLFLTRADRYARVRAVWLCAGIGVACGSGHGLVAAVATVLALVILYSYRFAYGHDAASVEMWDAPSR